MGLPNVDQTRLLAAKLRSGSLLKSDFQLFRGRFLEDVFFARKVSCLGGFGLERSDSVYSERHDTAHNLMDQNFDLGPHC